MGRTPLLALCLAVAPSIARAAPAADGDACASFVADLEKACASIVAKRDEIRSLSKTEAEEMANKPRIDALGAEIAQLTRAEPLGAMCQSVGASSPKTCDFLAKILPSDGDFRKPEEEAAKESGKEKKESKEKFASRVAMEQQPDRQTANNKSGSSAQIDPVESVQPITLAGGAVTLSGTRSGTKGVGTITVNPLALSRPDNVIAGRLFDITVSAPFDLNGGTSEDRRYVSGRIRINATAPFSAAPLQKAVAELMEEEGRYSDKLQVVLSKAPNLRGCILGILNTNKVTKAACGQDLSADGIDELRTEAFTKIKKAREEAESYYIGLDARVDSGDPTGPDVIGDKGTHVLGGVGAGVRISQGKESNWDWELRGRAAGDYFKSRDDAVKDDAKPVCSFDWGAAIIFSGVVQDDDKQRMAFGVGVEGRHAGKSDMADLAPTNYANLNLMAVVPAVSGGDLGLALSIPLADSAEPRGMQVMLSTDLGLLDRSK